METSPILATDGRRGATKIMQLSNGQWAHTSANKAKGMAASSVAAGGLYMHSELSELKSKRLQEFGVQLGPSSPDQRNFSRIPNSKMKKIRRLRERHVFDQSGRSSPEGDIAVCVALPSATCRKVLDPTPEFDEEVSLESPQPIETNGSCRIDDGNIAAGELSMSSEDSDLTAQVEVVNVSGTSFLVDFSLFKAYPDTLFGSEKIKEYFIASRNQYFLEKQKHVFGSVMRFYTNKEELVCPPCMPKSVFESELEFYGLLPYHQKANATSGSDLKEYKAKSRREEILLHIEFPGYSRCATLYAVFDLIMIIMSTVILVLESVRQLAENPHFLKICMITEVFVNVYFTLQTIVLISVYPSIRLYFSSITNWIDVISVIPFYLRLIAKEYLNQVGGFRVLRLIRLLRILKLFRHSPGSQTMIQFLITSIPEIILLLLMWSIGILMFGPLLYFVEQGNDEFTSAFSGMWFCVVTIGTVGYGDTVPKTEFGKILAACYTIINLTIMTIPISIIITKFNKTMKRSS